MNILLNIIIAPIIVIILFEIIIRYLIGESLIGMFLAVFHNSEEDWIKNEIKRIQKEESSKERIQYRKDCEDEANSILTKNLGKLFSINFAKKFHLL